MEKKEKRLTFVTIRNNGCIAFRDRLGELVIAISFHHRSVVHIGTRCGEVM